jgi:hypothetical protein
MKKRVKYVGMGAVVLKFRASKKLFIQDEFELNMWQNY